MRREVVLLLLILMEVKTQLPSPPQPHHHPSAPSQQSHSRPPLRVLPSTLSPSLSVASGLSGGYKYFRPNANENFRYESTSSFNPHGLQKKSPEIHPSRSKHPRTQSSLLSPPVLTTRPSFQHHLHSSNLAVVPGHPQDPHVGAGSSIAQDGGFSQEDEWKNIKVVRIKE